MLKDENVDLSPELFELIEDTAYDITAVLPDPSTWSFFITHLLDYMEEIFYRPDPIFNPGDSIDSTLEDICGLIRRRLNLGKW